MDFFMFYLLLLSFSTFYFADGKFCPDVTIMADFDPAKISGPWYTLGHTSKAFASSVKCIYNDFQILNETTTLVLMNAIVLPAGSPLDMTVTLTITDKPQVYEELALETPFTAQAINYVSPLGTDYETYLIAYSCDEDKKQYYSWIVTTERQTSESVLQDIEMVLTDNGVDFGIYGSIDQTDCPN